MANKVYTCRKCHKTFEAKEEEREVTWHQRSRGYYYHMECWQQYIQKDNDKNDDEWLDLIFDIFTRELNSSYDYFKVKKQVDNFLQGGYSMKGIYFTLYWFFCVQGGEYKPEYGIGIVPHIYERSVAYWTEQESKKKGIMDEIEKIKRIEAAEGRKVKTKQTRNKKKPTAEPTLD